MRLAVLFADGMEELEGLTPVDVLRRTDGAEVVTFSVGGEYITTSHGVKIIPDKMVSALDMKEFDGIIIPGGMPGATNIANNEYAKIAIESAENDKKLVAAICASPAVVLAGHGRFKGKKITCYPAPAFVESLNDYNYTAESVQVDGNLITANGPKSAFEFSLAICNYFQIKPKF